MTGLGEPQPPPLSYHPPTSTITTSSPPPPPTTTKEMDSAGTFLNTTSVPKWSIESYLRAYKHRLIIDFDKLCDSWVRALTKIAQDPTSHRKQAAATKLLNRYKVGVSLFLSRIMRQRHCWARTINRSTPCSAVVRPLQRRCIR